MTTPTSNDDRKMIAGVRKRRGTWEFVIDEARAVGLDGRTVRKQKWYRGYNTEKAAKIERAAMITKIAADAYVTPTKLTVAAYLRQWLDGQQRRLKASTHRSYVMNVEKHLIPHVGAQPIQTLSATALNALYTKLAGTTRRNGDGVLSPRTVRYVHTILRAALKDAARTGVTTRNVADLADPPKSTAAGVRPTWNVEELRAFLAHVADERLYAAWLFAATTGARRGEVLGLRWRDLDLDAGRASITQTVLAVRNVVSFSTPKTLRGRRAIALDGVTVTALRAHRVRQNAERLRAGSLWQANDLVFSREDGTPVHPDRFSDVFDKHVRNAELPRIRLHDLRHGHASLALQAGVHPKIVSERLGHSNISITLNTYSHVLPGLQDEAAEKVSSVLFGT